VKTSRFSVPTFPKGDKGKPLPKKGGIKRKGGGVDTHNTKGTIITTETIRYILMIILYG
jgi:hypothetical protein